MVPSVCGVMLIMFYELWILDVNIDHILYFQKTVCGVLLVFYLRYKIEEVGDKVTFR